ncbi:hypothetical protein QUF58_00755 [Anaerolineales bacterium HSG24]|nr:hypothetical protein [Anaerolineales bacterium HSG24]
MQTIKNYAVTIKQANMGRTVLLAVVLTLLLSGIALAAASSANHNIPSMTVYGTGSSVSSANHQTNYNVGQTASQSSVSSNYRANMGFWATSNIVVVPTSSGVYLPLVIRR